MVALVVVYADLMAVAAGLAAADPPVVPAAEADAAAPAEVEPAGVWLVGAAAPDAEAAGLVAGLAGAAGGAVADPQAASSIAAIRPEAERARALKRSSRHGSVLRLGAQVRPERAMARERSKRRSGVVVLAAWVGAERAGACMEQTSLV